ncbi:hypothetical protein NL676_003923 [Syzygium grande]|nr:hypothetical protein NL676_003923 [Syzygium grande]
MKVRTREERRKKREVDRIERVCLEILALKSPPPAYPPRIGSFAVLDWSRLRLPSSGFRRSAGVRSSVWVISGDDDLPKRDDIGERRRKHELQVLVGAGVKLEDDLGDEDGNLEANGGADSEDSESEESADEFYKQAKQQRAAKLAAKAEKYSRFVFCCSSKIFHLNLNVVPEE